MRVSLSQEALRDLRSIQAYVRQENPRAAAAIGRRLRSACRSLDQLPRRGRQGLKLGTRELTDVWPYVIVYRVADDYVEIVRIQHSRQQR